MVFAAFSNKRGRTYTPEKSDIYVYDTVSRDSAQIIRIDEAANPPSYSVIVTSKDINAWNIDNESPIPDNRGGFYFGAYSGDINAVPGSNTSKDCTVYHWNNTKKLTQTSVKNAQTTADLVIAEGQHAGKIVTFVYAAATNLNSDFKIESYIWDGVNNVDTRIDDGTMIGAELEKPFNDGSNGIYFMMELTLASEDSDALCHWNNTEGVKTIMSSDMELEVENPPLDNNVGFYFVNTNFRADSPEIVSKDGQITVSVDVGMVSVDMKLYHCTGWTTYPQVVCDLGVFRAPANAFVGASNDFFMVRELVQCENGILEDLEHDLLFVGAGPIGGRFKMTVFDWDETTQPNLTNQNIIATFNDSDLGGYVDVATAVLFD